jgi:hypothetical protein
VTQEEQWLNFHDATKEVRKKLGVSVGKAQAMLREACASGDVRSQREPYDPATGQGQAPPERIKPMQWSEDNIDLLIDADGCAYFVDVDAEDFDYWLDNQSKRKTKDRARPMDALARSTIAKLDLPDDMSTVEVHQRIGKELKTQGRQVPSLSVVKRIRSNKIMD